MRVTLSHHSLLCCSLSCFQHAHRAPEMTQECTAHLERMKEKKKKRTCPEVFDHGTVLIGQCPPWLCGTWGQSIQACKVHSNQASACWNYPKVAKTPLKYRAEKGEYLLQHSFTLQIRNPRLRHKFLIKKKTTGNIYKIVYVVCFRLFQNNFVEDDGKNAKTDRHGRDLRGDLGHSSHLADEG